MMQQIDTVDSIAFALDPNNTPSFLLDWELTKLCNLDCGYCPTGVDGGHDNSTKHPDLNECLKTIDFMYKYVDLYNQHKKLSQRNVILNVYGGESLFHPDIVEILQACRDKHQPYKDLWHLTITCTTNAVVGANRWEEIVPLIDEFTVSYHPENLPKQKQQYLNNVLYLKEQEKRFKCIVMMHNDPVLFADSEKIVEFCKINNLRYLAKPLDNDGNKWTYTQDQYNRLIKKEEQKIEFVSKEKISSISVGRQCCGGRKLSINNDLKSFVSFVPKQGFEDWFCSVNWFFLFVQQLTGNVYTNKDCRTSTSGLVEPLGNINNYNQILDTLQKQLDTSSMPVIQCVKQTCICGICAPKAKEKKEFINLIKRNVPNISIFKLTEENNHG